MFLERKRGSSDLPLEGRKDGWMGGKEGKHLLDTSYVPTYFAMYMNFYFLICLIITLQSKNSTHIKDEKNQGSYK